MMNLPTRLATHWVVLAVVLINASSKLFWGLGFIPPLDNILKGLVVLTSILALIIRPRPSGLIKTYLLIYPISLGLLLFAFLIRGIVGAIIAGMLLFPFDLNHIVHVEGSVTIYTDSKGLMSRCCTYKATESKYSLLEQQLGSFENDGMINFEEATFYPGKQGLQLSFPHKYFDVESNTFKVSNRTVILEK